MPGCDPVQPDLLVVWTEDLSIIRDRRIYGVPALLIEILSPSNPEQDLVLKRDWYGLQVAGGNQYALVKLGGALGINLVQQGAQMRGETLEQFLETRKR